MRARWSAASSGRPNTQSLAVRCAVLASIRQVAGLVTSAAASRAAASGRQRKATSAAFSRRARSVGSLRSSGAARSTSTSLRRARYSLMRRPVVPSWPSTKTRVVMVSSREGIDSIKHVGPFLRAAARTGDRQSALHGDEETEGSRHGAGSAARSPRRRRRRRAARSRRRAAHPGARPAAARPLPAAHAHRRRRAVRAGREHQGAGRDAAGAGAAARADRRRRRAPLRDHRRRAALSRRHASPASTPCRCSSATSATRPPRRWR